MSVAQNLAGLQKAIDIAGGQTQLSALLKGAGHNVSQQLISHWVRSRGASPQYVMAICAVLDGQVQPHELRADIYKPTGAVA